MSKIEARIINREYSSANRARSALAKSRLGGKEKKRLGALIDDAYINHDEDDSDQAVTVNGKKLPPPTPISGVKSFANGRHPTMVDQLAFRICIMADKEAVSAGDVIEAIRKRIGELGLL